MSVGPLVRRRWAGVGSGFPGWETKRPGGAVRDKATYRAAVAAEQAAFPPALNGWTHVVLPLLMLGCASAVLIGADGDRLLASWLYGLEGGHWAMKQAWLTEGLIHRGGRALSGLASLAVGLLMLRGFCARHSRLRAARWPLLRLLASVALATGVISLIKQHSGMDCPWDLSQYGGLRPYYSLFASRPAGLRASGCFPAGHASAGYAWLGLYCFAVSVRPRWASRALALGLGAGLVFGIGQQLRGAHFLSHDVWTAAICWFVALGIHLLGVAARGPAGRVAGLAWSGRRTR